MRDVTQILSRIEQGNPGAAEQLLLLVYSELCKLAAAKLAREKSGQTLQATALVHEADQYAPVLVGLPPAQREFLNDDRLSRCLDRLFEASHPELILAVVRHVIKEFGLRLHEFHNDSTTVSFFGAFWPVSCLGRCGKVD